MRTRTRVAALSAELHDMGYPRTPQCPVFVRDGRGGSGPAVIVSTDHEQQRVADEVEAGLRARGYGFTRHDDPVTWTLFRITGRAS